VTSLRVKKAAEYFERNGQYSSQSQPDQTTSSRIKIRKNPLLPNLPKTLNIPIYLLVPRGQEKFMYGVRCMDETQNVLNVNLNIESSNIRGFLLLFVLILLLMNFLERVYS
jgi:hypothetical protein